MDLPTNAGCLAFFQVGKWGKITLHLSTISKAFSQIGPGNI